MDKASPYAGREQSLVKHIVLQRYLLRLALIIGSKWEAITYVDCFSGPWKVRANDLSDSSFAIALNELRRARDTLTRRSRNMRIRCLFLEKDPQAFARLQQFCRQQTDVQVAALNQPLECAVDHIVGFVSDGGQRAFSFLFIDPTGWTGFGMATIAPLLRLRPGEVLINFMTGHIARFINSPFRQTQESFEDLFGSAGYRQRIQGLRHRDREDELVKAYRDNVACTGGFPFTCSAVVLHPRKARTHFHLVYATRHEKGGEVFKDVEKGAMAEMETVRLLAQKGDREQRSGQMELPEINPPGTSAYYSDLRTRYLARAQKAVESLLAQGGPIAYDVAWATALSEPLVWESDLKAWIRDWAAKGCLALQGLAARQGVSQRGSGHTLTWQGARRP